MNQINTLIKPTHDCNMRCKYCFHEKYGYSNGILKMEALKKYLTLLSKKYKYINLVWHGGEPLIAPLEYYKEIYDYCKSLDTEFIYSLQTNGVLLNQKFIDFFKENDTHIGLSFDGLSNEENRGNTSRILNNIDLLHKNDMYPGAIVVVNQNNVNNLIENYEYFKSLNLGMKINPMFNDGAAKENKYLNLSPDDYIKNFIEFFIYWSKDRNCNINVNTCEELVDMVINEHSGICTCNSCLGKWLCLDSNGYIYPCDRLCIPKYNFGNIMDMDSIDKAFMNDNFVNLLKQSILRREKCIENCEYFNNCYGGCNANAILSNENSACYIRKNILKSLKEYILSSDKRYSSMNPHYLRMLKY